MIIIKKKVYLEMYVVNELKYIGIYLVSILLLIIQKLSEVSYWQKVIRFGCWSGTCNKTLDW